MCMDKSKLFTVYNRAKAVAHQGKLEPKRVNRALGIAQSREYPAKYVTTINSCTCPDSQYRHAICKHRLALAIKVRMSEI